MLHVHATDFQKVQLFSLVIPSSKFRYDLYIRNVNIQDSTIIYKSFTLKKKNSNFQCFIIYTLYFIIALYENFVRRDNGLETVVHSTSPLLLVQEKTEIIIQKSSFAFPQVFLLSCVTPHLIRRLTTLWFFLFKSFKEMTRST